MTYLKTLFNHILQKPSLYFFVFLVIFTFDRHHRYEAHKENLGTFYQDVEQYYRFLPNFFIDSPEVAETGIKQNKRTIGMALMYAPGFAIGHLKAKLTGAPATGYSLPYQWAVRWGSIIYVIIGLFFCRKSLLMFFSETVTLIVLISLLFATNLFYYTYSWGELAHGYLFCLNAIFIYCILQSLIHAKPRYFIWAGLMAGLITLIRPTGILVLLFPLLYNVYSFNDFTNRVKYIFASRRIAGLSLLLFSLPLLAQMIFWKIYFGQFIYYSYGKERFFFDDPQIVNFLFSYLKGWFVYTPIMLLALVGMLLSYKRMKPFFLFNIVLLSLTVYILSSWWDWTSGGSLGCRVMIEFYAFFAFPLGVFISWFWHNHAKNIFFKYCLRIVPLIVFWLFIELNLLQSMQLRFSIMHWDGVSKESYWLMFGKYEFTKAELEEIRAKDKLPDPDKMLRGERDF